MQWHLAASRSGVAIVHLAEHHIGPIRREDDRLLAEPLNEMPALGDALVERHPEDALAHALRHLCGTPLLSHVATAPGRIP